MSEYLGDKTLEPTPHRREQARREGQVPRSRDLTSAGVLLLSLGVLALLGGSLAGFLVDYCRNQLGGQAWLNADADFAVAEWHSVVQRLGRYLLPVLGLIFLSGIAANVMQTGFRFLPQRLSLDPNRVNPLAGMSRMFSSPNFVALGFGVVKLAVVVAAACAIVHSEIGTIAGLASLAPSELALGMTQIIFRTALKLGGALFVLALLDYGYQRLRHERDLRMTPQELREEARNLEGDPQLASRRKRMQRDIVQQRSMPPDAPLSQADRLRELR